MKPQYVSSDRVVERPDCETMTDPFQELTRLLIEFRDARDWRQFHGLKNLMLSLNLEAAEILELGQWRTDDEIEQAATDPKFRERLGEECADVLLYLLLICERAGIDLESAARAKMETNAAKYPVEKSRGNARKYSSL
jgi:NTP pyrophosphatase (non-canonical NTP hydrolase)